METQILGAVRVTSKYYICHTSIPYVTGCKLSGILTMFSRRYDVHINFSNRKIHWCTARTRTHIIRTESQGTYHSVSTHKDNIKYLR